MADAPTIEDRLTVLEAAMKAMQADVAKAASVKPADASKLEAKVQQMAADVAEHMAWMKSVRAK